MVPSPGGLANGLPSLLVFIWPQELPNVHTWGALSPSGKQGCSWAQGRGDAAPLFTETAGLGSVPSPWVFCERHPAFRLRKSLRAQERPKPCRHGPRQASPRQHPWTVSPEVFTLGPGSAPDGSRPRRTVPSGVSPGWGRCPQAPGRVSSELSLGPRGAPRGGRGSGSRACGLNAALTSVGVSGQIWGLWGHLLGRYLSPK